MILPIVLILLSLLVIGTLIGWIRARRSIVPRRPLLQAPGKLLHALPIYWLENVINDQENQHLLGLGRAKLNRSKVEGDVISPDRTSSSAYLDDDPVIDAIKDRLSRVCNYPVGKFEPLQMVHYDAQQQYKPHHDYLDKPGGPHRHVTFFIYLDDADGATEFPQLGLQVQPKRNGAAMWYNVLPDGRPDPRTLHAGRPPTKEKNGINVWVRG